jgi:hypothetical protein
MWRRGRKLPRLTATVWLSARKVRQQLYPDLLQSGVGHLFDYAYMEAVDRKRDEYDKIFWKTALSQFTIVALLGLSLLSLEVNFSLFGLSSSAIFKFREFLLLAHALIMSYEIVLQQYIHKLEDLLIAYAKQRCPQEDVTLTYALRFLSPIETFNVGYLPYKKHQFHNRFGEVIQAAFTICRVVTAVGFAALAMLIPSVAAIYTVLNPNYGWLTYVSAGYWAVAAVFSVFSALINVFGIPFTDFSYVMRLAELQKRDPEAHRRMFDEMERAGKLAKFPEDGPEIHAQ